MINTTNKKLIIKDIIISFLLTLSSSLFYARYENTMYYYFGFPYGFIQTVHKEFLLNKFYFFNPINLIKGNNSIRTQGQNIWYIYAIKTFRVLSIEGFLIFISLNCFKNCVKDFLKQFNFVLEIAAAS